MDWNEGYRTDVNYTHGYYREMNPCGMHFLMLMAGIVPPSVTNACELGYGQGLSINIHAAAENIAWTGTDFNPGQAAFAQEMARVSGARANCYAEPFHEFCEREDLPEFDYIALHGIWSWISPENQAAIVRLIDKKLKIGGVVYTSYNTFPGWAAFMPARDLMKLYSERHEAQGRPILDKVADSFAFLGQLAELGAAYFAANPAVQKRLELFRDKDSAYLAHEFLNDAWAPCSFADMAATLGEARLSFACSASPVMLIPGTGANEEQRKLLASIADPVLKETVSDFILNTQFRKDYWIKGLRQLQPHARLEMLGKAQFVPVAMPDKIGREVKMGSSTITVSEASHQVFRSVLGDGKVHSLAELEKKARELAAGPNAPEGAERENLLTLAHVACACMAAGIIAPAQEKQDAARAKPCAEKLNAYIEQLAISSGQIGFLASPVTGGGIAAGRFDMLFLLALRRGAKTVDALALFARNCLNLVGQQIVRNGAPMTDQDEMLSHLRELAENFNTERLPVFRNLLPVQA